MVTSMTMLEAIKDVRILRDYACSADILCKVYYLEAIGLVHMICSTMACCSELRVGNSESSLSEITN